MIIKNIYNQILFENSEANLIGANLTGANLTEAYLAGADLTRADLTRADLTRADLFEAHLTGAHLTGADLTRADLTGADLTGANFTEADLTRADLTGANFTEADLTRANFTKANFTRTNLTGARLSISSILHSIQWGTLSNELTLELMRRDALICGEEKMIEWSSGGTCPFSKNILRDFYFTEERKLYKPGLPRLNDLELFKTLCKESDIIHDIP